MLKYVRLFLFSTTFPESRFKSQWTNIGEELYQDYIRTFRYEACLKELLNQTELSEADANFRDLLLSEIGHIHRQAQASGSVPLGIDLERFIDDRRRLQNEKFIKQESDLECTPEARALLDAQSIHLPSSTGIRR
jgi:hypothetical protein